MRQFLIAASAIVVVLAVSVAAWPEPCDDVLLQKPCNQCVRWVRGFDVTGHTQSVKSVLAQSWEMQSACDCFNLCLKNNATCTAYSWKFDNSSASIRTCTLFSDVRLPVGVVFEYYQNKTVTTNITVITNTTTIVNNGTNESSESSVSSTSNSTTTSTGASCPPQPQIELVTISGGPVKKCPLGSYALIDSSNSQSVNGTAAPTDYDFLCVSGILFMLETGDFIC